MKKHLFLPISIILTSFSCAIQAADKLVVYSSRSDKLMQPVVDKFTAQTGIDVTLHSGQSAELLNKLQIESDRTEADLFISNDAGTLQKGGELQLFSALPDELLNPVPANYRAKDNTWVGLSACAHVLVINSKNPAAAEIKSVFDLAAPKLKGDIGVTNSGNESFIAGVTVYELTVGQSAAKAWLKGLKENAKRNVFEEPAKIVSEVASGKLDVGLVNHYYIYRYLDENPQAPIKIVMPDQGEDSMGVAWNVAGIAVTKYGKQQELAQKFVAYLLSEEGQRLFADVNYEYPTREGVAANAKIPAVGSFKIAPIPMYQLGTKRDEALKLIETAGMP